MILLIAYGNPLLGDDGAGLRLAARLETALRRLAIAARRVETHQLLPELAADIADPQTAAVVFVDTRVAAADGEHVAVERIQPSDASSPSLGHSLDPAAVLTYASVLSNRPPLPAWLVTAPGWQFGFGESISPQSEELIYLALNDPQSQLQRLVVQLHQLCAGVV